VIPFDDLMLAIIVVVITAVLWAVFRFTRFGLATRAAAENEKGAVLLGFLQRQGRTAVATGGPRV